MHLCLNHRNRLNLVRNQVPNRSLHMKQYLCVLMLLFTLALSTGCGNPVTKDNYERIETGMTLDEVESILGSGTVQASSDASFGGISMNVKNMVWQDGDRIITVVFSHDKVKAKSQIGL